MCHSHRSIDVTNANLSRNVPSEFRFSDVPGAPAVIKSRSTRKPMKPTRRDFLHIGASGLAATLAGASTSSQAASSPASSRTFHFVQIDVFTSHRFQGNQLAVFPDARGLSDTEL